MTAEKTYFYLQGDSTALPQKKEEQVPAPAGTPQNADTSTIQTRDSATVKKKKDSVRVVSPPAEERFKLPDTIRIEYAKPGYKLKRIKKDSLAVSDTQAAKDTNLVPFYNNHLLKTIHTNPVPLNRENSDWTFYVILFIVGAFTFIKVIHSKNLKQIREAFLSNTMSNQIVRDESILFQRASVFLTVIFYIVGALFLYKLSTFYEVSYPYLPSGFGRFLIFVLLISLVYSLKLILLKLVGFIFQVDRAVTSYIFNVFLINNVLGIVLIPILICVFFMPPAYITSLIHVGEALVVLAFVYRIIRGITIGLSYPNFSVYYLFLYLCSLEIAPLLFLIKMLS
jgi:hypothetical protein